MSGGAGPHGEGRYSGGGGGASSALVWVIVGSQCAEKGYADIHTYVYDHNQLNTHATQHKCQTNKMAFWLKLGRFSQDLSTPNQTTTTPPHTMHGTCMKALKGGLGVRHVEGEDMDVRTDNRKDREQEGDTWQGHREGWTQKSKI